MIRPALFFVLFIMFIGVSMAQTWQCGGVDCPTCNADETTQCSPNGVTPSCSAGNCEPQISSCATCPNYWDGCDTTTCAATGDSEPICKTQAGVVADAATCTTGTTPTCACSTWVWWNSSNVKQDPTTANCPAQAPTHGLTITCVNSNGVKTAESLCKTSDKQTAEDYPCPKWQCGSSDCELDSTCNADNTTECVDYPENDMTCTPTEDCDAKPKSCATCPNYWDGCDTTTCAATGDSEPICKTQAGVVADADTCTTGVAPTCACSTWVWWNSSNVKQDPNPSNCPAQAPTHGLTITCVNSNGVKTAESLCKTSDKQTAKDFLCPWQCGSSDCLTDSTCNADNTTECFNSPEDEITCLSNNCSDDEPKSCETCPNYWTCDTSLCSTTGTSTPQCLAQDGSTATTCTGSAPTCVCGTNKCSFVDFTSPDTVVELVDCTPTTCNAYHSLIFDSSDTDHDDTKDSFLDCSKSTQLTRHVYCVDADDKIIASSNCLASGASGYPTTMACDRLCQAQCVWHVDDESSPVSGDFSAENCNLTCQDDASEIGIANCAGAEPKVTCVTASGFNAQTGLTFTASSTTTATVCGSKDMSTLPSARCEATCGEYRCTVVGHEDSLDEGKDGDLCAVTTCSAAITYLSDEYSIDLVDDGATAVCAVSPAITSACYKKTSTDSYEYDATGDSCALATDEIVAPTDVECYPKSCYSTLCAFTADAMSSPESAEYSEDQCETTFFPVCDCSCDTTCPSTDYTLKSKCQLTVGSTTTDVDSTQDSDRFDTVCVPPTDATRKCVVDTDNCVAQVTEITVDSAIFNYVPAIVSFKYQGDWSTNVVFHIVLDSTETTFDQVVLTATPTEPFETDPTDATKFIFTLKAEELAKLPAAPSTGENKYKLYAVVVDSTVTADTAERSAAFTVETYCQYQGIFDVSDRCSGAENASCDVTANQCTCPLFVANPSYYPSTRDCSCPDLNHTDPTQCTFAQTCDDVLDADTCVNGFQTIGADGKCTGTCTCTGGFTGDACDQCTLSCGANGSPDATCSACVCQPGFAGATCTTTPSIAVGIKFAKAPANFSGSNLQRFQREFLAQLAQLIGVDQSFFTLPARLPATSGFSVLDIAIGSDETVTVRANILVDQTDGPTKSQASDAWINTASVASVNTLSTSNELGGATAVTGVCAGAECTDEEFVTTEPANEDHGKESADDIAYNIITIVIVVALVVIAIVVIVSVVCCNKMGQKKENKAVEDSPSSEPAANQPQSDTVNSHLELV